MEIAILEPKIKSKFLRIICSIVLFITTLGLSTFFLTESSIVGLIMSFVPIILLFIIVPKIIEAYKIIGAIELTNYSWIINKSDLQKELFITDIKKIYFKPNLSKMKNFRSYIATIILKNNESYVLEISKVELKNGKLLSSFFFNMDSRFDLFEYLKKNRIKYKLE